MLLLWKPRGLLQAATSVRLALPFRLKFLSPSASSLAKSGSPNILHSTSLEPALSAWPLTPTTSKLAWSHLLEPGQPRSQTPTPARALQKQQQWWEACAETDETQTCRTRKSPRCHPPRFTFFPGRTTAKLCPSPTQLTKQEQAPAQTHLPSSCQHLLELNNRDTGWHTLWYKAHVAFQHDPD